MIPLIKKTESPYKAEKKSDRIVILKPMDGKKVQSTSGLADPRLFTGENELHIYRDQRLWKIRYKMGGVAEPLKQSFTTFDQTLAVVKQYFLRRNIEVTGVID